MCEAQDPRGPQGPSKEPSQMPSKGKKRVPAWSVPEVLTLLELWGEEEALQALHTRCRNADIYGCMAQGLAQKGHHPRTLDQVWAKVKVLRQGYAKARERSSTSGAAPVRCAYHQELDRILGGQEPLSAPVLMQTGLHTPVQHCQKGIPDTEEQLPGEEEEEEEETTETAVTLTLQPVPETQEASQASSKSGEGTSAGPAAANYQAKPMPPPTWSHGTHRHWRVYNDLLRRHVEAMERMEDTMAERTREEARWHNRLLEDFLPQWSAMCATVREALAVLCPLPLGTPPTHPAPAPSAPPSSPSATATPSSPSAPATPPALPLPPPTRAEQSAAPPPHWHSPDSTLRMAGSMDPRWQRFAA